MKESKIRSIQLSSVRELPGEEISKLFQQSMLLGNFMYDLQLRLDDSIDFAKRLAWLSKGFYLIKSAQGPKKIAGACFIYKSKNTLFYGAAILPHHYSRELLNQAIEQISSLSRYCYGLTEINFKLTLFTFAMSQLSLSSKHMEVPDNSKSYRIFAA